MPVFTRPPRFDFSAKTKIVKFFVDVKRNFLNVRWECADIAHLIFGGSNCFSLFDASGFQHLVNVNTDELHTKSFAQCLLKSCPLTVSLSQPRNLTNWWEQRLRKILPLLGESKVAKLSRILLNGLLKER